MMMHTLKEAIDLAGQGCLAWLNPQQDYLPTGGYEVAHDVGRWWDAMLRREAAIDIAIPAEIEGAMLRNLQVLTDNPDGLLINKPGWHDLASRINPHNFREAMLAFNALVRYRKSEWARVQGHRLLETLDRIVQPDGRLDYSLLHCYGQIPVTTDPSHDQKKPGEWFDATANTGRCLEGIVWFYEATGDSLALQLAERLAQHHLANTVSATGDMRQEIIDPENVGHCHSYLGTLRGLLLFGLLTRQHEYVDAVNWTYRKSFSTYIITESGWTAHDLGKIRFPNDTDGNPVAETASCSDVVQLALWLALRAGQIDLLDDVERLIQSRILPAQITDTVLLEDERLRSNPKAIGGWGCHGHPHDRDSTHDVLAAVLHSLSDVYCHIVTRDFLGLTVQLNFTCETENVSLRSLRSEDARLTIIPRVQDNILIRIPGWVPPESIQLTVKGRSYPLYRVGVYLHIARDDVSVGDEILLTHVLPERYSRERTRAGQEYNFLWKGDQIIGCDPPVPIYPSMPGEGKS